MTTDRNGLDFYALGKVTTMPDITTYMTNRGIKDTSNELLARNALSLNSGNLESVRNNYRQLHTLSEANQNTNNYLNPISTYRVNEKYTIKSDMNNQEVYRIAKSKMFASDKSNELPSGVRCSKEDFVKNKNNLSTSVISHINSNKSMPILDRASSLKDNSLVFDKNNKAMIRYPKGFWNYNPEYIYLIYCVAS